MYKGALTNETDLCYNPVEHDEHRNSVWCRLP